MGGALSGHQAGMNFTVSLKSRLIEKVLDKIVKTLVNHANDKLEKQNYAGRFLESGRKLVLCVQFCI